MAGRESLSSSSAAPSDNIHNDAKLLATKVLALVGRNKKLQQSTNLSGRDVAQLSAAVDYDAAFGPGNLLVQLLGGGRAEHVPRPTPLLRTLRVDGAHVSVKMHAKVPTRHAQPTTTTTTAARRSFSAGSRALGRSASATAAGNRDRSPSPQPSSACPYEPTGRTSAGGRTTASQQQQQQRHHADPQDPRGSSLQGGYNDLFNHRQSVQRLSATRAPSEMSAHTRNNVAFTAPTKSATGLVFAVPSTSSTVGAAATTASAFGSHGKGKGVGPAAPISAQLQQQHFDGTASPQQHHRPPLPTTAATVDDERHFSGQGGGGGGGTSSNRVLVGKGLGQHNAADLGLLDTQVSEDWEATVRLALSKMNISVDPERDLFGQDATAASNALASASLLDASGASHASASGAAGLLNFTTTASGQILLQRPPQAHAEQVDALEDPLRNGSVLARLVNHIVVPHIVAASSDQHRHNQHQHQHVDSYRVRVVVAQGHTKLSLEQCRAHFVGALARIRQAIETGPYSKRGGDSRHHIPHAFLHLRPEDVLRGYTTELWGLLYHVLREFTPPAHVAAPWLYHGVLPRPSSSGASSSSANGEGTYSPANMRRLDQSVCDFLVVKQVLLGGALLPQLDNDRIDQYPLVHPLHAPYLPQQPDKCRIVTSRIHSVTHPAVWPYICNGTILCDLVACCFPQSHPLKPFRNPKTPSRCVSNVDKALRELRKLQPKISPMYLSDAARVYTQDLAYILFMLEDVMRLYYTHYTSGGAGGRSSGGGMVGVGVGGGVQKSRRRVPPSHNTAPFLREQPALSSAGSSSRGARHGATGAPDNDAAGSGAQQHQHHQIHEMQRYASVQKQVAASRTSTAAAASFISNSHLLKREDSLGATASGGEDEVDVTAAEAEASRRAQPMAASSSSFVSSSERQQQRYALAPTSDVPQMLRTRNAAVTTTAPSSGRSIVHTDDIRNDDDLLEEQPDPTPLLPRHLDYLNRVAVTHAECESLANWLISKLGAGFCYMTTAVQLDMRTFSFSEPCMALHDGYVLAELVSILMYRKCPALQTVQRNPKSTAAKKHNIRKVLAFLSSEKRILTDAIFLDEALLLGDLRAVILVLRAIKSAFRNHNSTMSDAKKSQH